MGKQFSIVCVSGGTLEARVKQPPPRSSHPQSQENGTILVHGSRSNTAICLEPQSIEDPVRLL